MTIRLTNGETPNNMYDDESKGHEGLTSAGFEGDLFNEGSEVNFDEAFTEMEGSEALGIGFEESEINTNINMYDDSTTNMIFDQSSIIQMNEDMDTPRGLQGVEDGGRSE